MFYAHALRDGRGHAHTYMTTFTRFTQNCVLGSLVVLCIESSCYLKKTVVDIKITRVGGVYCEEDAGFSFCLVCGSLLTKKKNFLCKTSGVGRAMYLAHIDRQAIHESFLHEILISYQFAKSFLHLKFSAIMYLTFELDVLTEIQIIVHTCKSIS